VTPPGAWPRFPTWPMPVCLLALAVPLADLYLVGLLRWDYILTPSRALLALTAAVALTELTPVRERTLPSAFAPVPSWSCWVWAAFLLAAALFVVVLVTYLALRLVGIHVPYEATPLDGIPEALHRMCLDAPLVEEVIYRLALVGAVVSLAGPGWAIVTSGVLFAQLHWVYGNPSPENQVGGFILAWMYLRSGTLAVPVLFHAGGNLGALALQVLAYYVLRPSPGG